MSAIQCPFCFERIPVHLEAIRTTQTRRCPRGKSAAEAPGASLQHCYCKADSYRKMPTDPVVYYWLCCKCGDPLKRKL